MQSTPRKSKIIRSNGYADAAPANDAGADGRYIDGQFDIPDIRDLAAHLRFSPNTGRIWLDDNRMLLMHSRSLGALRQELVETLGLSAARALMMRMGYASGAQDAEMANKVRGGSFNDFFLAGPQLHALEGLVRVEVLQMKADVPSGQFFADCLWHDSCEDEVHIAAYGIGSEPACWMQIGYASGYTSVFMGRPILYREVECRSTGHDVCRIIGKPVSEWGEEARDDLRHLQPQSFVNQDRLSVSRATAAAPVAPVGGDEPGGAGVAAPSAGGWKKMLVGASTGFNVVCHTLEKVAGTNATVLLLGESGVGKEIFAQTLHRISKRAEGAFVAVNCAAIPEHLLEAELFGVEKGAFTGAVTSRPGRFERANGGTLFLDEIGTLTLPAQGKLLRALQEREIERVGDGKTRPVDVRVVAATNEDLRDCVRRGLFREDLFYRLNVFPIRIPPLRERRADIPLLMDYFLKQFCERHSKSISGFTQRAIHALYSYEWRGNVRELENVIERAVILVPEGEPIDVFHLFTSGERLDSDMLEMSGDGRLNVCHAEPAGGAADMQVGGSAVDLALDRLLGSELSLDDLEEELLHAAVRKAGGNISEGARMLGITRPQLDYRLKKSAQARAARGAA